MDRRKFISSSVTAGVAAGTAWSFLPLDTVFAAAANAPQLPYDMVAVMGGEPAAMFDKAIAALGGMKSFVKSGQTVVVKPNIGWDRKPEMAANTHPELVAAVVSHCLKAGAKEVLVLDHSCDNWIKAYATSGIEAAAKQAGARLVSADAESQYQTVSIPKGVRLKTAKVHQAILNADVLINVPVLKHHDGAGISLCMKNLMGIVWDRGFWHRNDLQQCIADMATWRKPDLNIVDGYRVLQKNGPKGVTAQDAVLRKSLILSKDMVAADSAAARIFGKEPATIGHIRIANEMGIGVMDTDKLNIHRIKL